jgi:hypothetical protein
MRAEELSRAAIHASVDFEYTTIWRWKNENMSNHRNSAILGASVPLEQS